MSIRDAGLSVRLAHQPLTYILRNNHYVYILLPSLTVSLPPKVLFVEPRVNHGRRPPMQHNKSASPYRDQASTRSQVSGQPVIRLRQHLADDPEKSARAVSDLRPFCQAHVLGRHEIEVIDVFKQPNRVMATASS